jgi:hypothetical protein
MQLAPRARLQPTPGAGSRRSNAASESGYAMLLVFLMAAIIAIALYNELPRTAFEAQRAKEQLLIERGEQYKRAIQLFVRKVGRYPATIEELENLNNVRFLRKRYRDPMTGNEKWRLIHVNAGVLTDSIIQKNKPGQDQQQANTNTFIGEGPVMGTAKDPTQQQINPGMQRRASDDRPELTQELPDPPTSAGVDQGDSTTDNNDNSNDANSNNNGTAVPGTPATAANTPGMPNQQPPGPASGRFQQPGMYPGQPGYNPATANQPNAMTGASPNQNSGLGGSLVGNGGLPNGDPSSGSSVYAAPYLGQSPSLTTDVPAGVTGLPGHGDVLGGRDARTQRLAQQSAADAQSGLASASTGPASQNPTDGFGGNSPAPASPTNMQPSAGLPGMGGTQVGGGIAGVASESTGPAIKVYNERKKYNEWEFVYDQSKDRGLAGVQRNGGAPGTPAQSMASAIGQQPGIGGAAGSVGFGQSAPQQSQPQPQPPN